MGGCLKAVVKVGGFILAVASAGSGAGVDVALDATLEETTTVAGEGAVDVGSSAAADAGTSAAETGSSAVAEERGGQLMAKCVMTVGAICSFITGGSHVVGELGEPVDSGYSYIYQLDGKGELDRWGENELPATPWGSKLRLSGGDTFQPDPYRAPPWSWGPTTITQLGG
jgi:hypothetical protein